MVDESLSATDARADFGIRLTTGQESRSSASFECSSDDEVPAGGEGAGCECWEVAMSGGDVGCVHCGGCTLRVASSERQSRQCQTESASASLTLSPAHIVCHRVVHAEQRMDAFLVDELEQPPQVFRSSDSHESAFRSIFISYSCPL